MFEGEIANCEVLNNPRAKITSLNVCGTNFGDREVDAVISSSAMKKMKELILGSESLRIDCVCALNALLCDSSSIEAISNSNHSLLEIKTFENSTPRSKNLSGQIFDWLELYKMKWKKTVIHKKIVKY